MKNIERFNVYTAQIFSMLYASFPVARPVRTMQVFDAVRNVLSLDPAETVEQDKFIANTMMWLEETGYVKARGAGVDRKLVLTPRAFEAMNAPLPKSLRQRDEAETKSVGEKMAEVTHQFGADLMSEGRKQIASQLVGQVIGHAMRSFTGP